MAIEGVIFDWGGTLTPWHTVDHDALWQAACEPHFPAPSAIALASAARAAEAELWLLAEREHKSATLAEVFARAGVSASASAGLLASYYAAWDPHTLTDPEVAPLFTELRRRGLRVGVLSNTMWPRDAHERIFVRDNVLDLIDGAVYSSEIPWVKPHREAFAAAMAAIGVTDPAACVFVGDRPYDDVHGAKSAGMRAVLIPNSAVPTYDAVTPDAVISRLADLLPHLDTWAKLSAGGAGPSCWPIPRPESRRPAGGPRSGHFAQRERLRACPRLSCAIRYRFPIPNRTR